MVKITMYMAMSLNGHIATEDDETPWSDEIWKSYYKIASKFKAIIVGRKTYELMSAAGEFDKIGNPLTIVLSTKRRKESEKTFFVSNPGEAITLLQEKRVNEAILGGGSRTNGAFMNEDLVDEVLIDIEPVILGKGISLFNDFNFQRKLSLIKTKQISDNVIQLHYKVKK